MSISVLVEIENGDKQLNEITTDVIFDYNTLVKIGKKAIYDTRAYNDLKFSSVYKSVLPNSVVFLNDKILGNKKGILQSYTINISKGVVDTEYNVRCDYE